MPGASLRPKRKSLRFQSAEVTSELPREVICLAFEGAPIFARISSFVFPSERLPEELMISTPGAMTNKLLRFCISVPRRRVNIVS